MCEGKSCSYFFMLFGPFNKVLKHAKRKKMKCRNGVISKPRAHNCSMCIISWQHKGIK